VYIILDTSSILFAMEGRKSALDTVMLKHPGKRILISEGVIKELTGIGSGNGKRAATARACLGILKLKNVEVDKNKGNVDLWILERAKEKDVYCVITNDTELFNKLRSKHIAVFKLSRNGMLK
jgi:rRNA-processing protein FCF1